MRISINNHEFHQTDTIKYIFITKRRSFIGFIRYIDLLDQVNFTVRNDTKSGRVVQCIVDLDSNLMYYKELLAPCCL